MKNASSAQCILAYDLLVIGVCAAEWLSASARSAPADVRHFSISLSPTKRASALGHCMRAVLAGASLSQKTALLWRMVAYKWHYCTYSREERWN